MKPGTLSFALATTWMMHIAVPSAFPFFFFFIKLWSAILDLFIKPLIYYSIFRMIFFSFSIAIKRIVCIASMTQTIAYVHAYNYADISSILLTLKQFVKDSWMTLQSQVKKLVSHTCCYYLTIKIIKDNKMRSSVEFLLTSKKISKTSSLWANSQNHLRLIMSIFTLLEHAKLFYSPWVEGNETSKI